MFQDPPSNSKQWSLSEPNTGVSPCEIDFEGALGVAGRMAAPGRVTGKHWKSKFLMGKYGEIVPSH